ncbi:MAG TPA: isocitrate lyase/phosphoenolpyruvate mutase family protein [Actinomycetota bacterium]|jgi:2-methylisocitrate lyase-like PEP mutase family enzyme
MPDRTQLAEKAAALAALHVPGDPVVLPNAWDVTSARAFVKEGFPAIATSSSAVARSLGFQDGEDTPPDEMFAAIARMTGAVDVPVTADIERGYGLEPEEIVARLLDAGAVGCNLEDSHPPTGEAIAKDTQAEWLGRVRAAASSAGVDVVLNARVDVFLKEWGAPDERLADAIARGTAYFEAGATCVYPFGLPSPSEIEEYVRAVNGPINAVFLPDGPPLSDLAAAGVARVTFGGGLHIAMQHLLRQAAARIRAGGSPYEEL